MGEHKRQLPSNYEHVNHPDHYQGKIEAIDYIEDKLPDEQYIGFLRGTALRYMSRFGKKEDDLADTKKGLWYLEKLAEFLKKKKDREALWEEMDITPAEKHNPNEFYLKSATTITAGDYAASNNGTVTAGNSELITKTNSSDSPSDEYDEVNGFEYNPRTDILRLYTRKVKKEDINTGEDDGSIKKETN